MNDVSKPAGKQADETDDTVKTPPEDRRGGRWTKAGMGIGSAALVAALLYANRGKLPKKGD